MRMVWIDHKSFKYYFQNEHHQHQHHQYEIIPIYKNYF